MPPEIAWRVVSFPATSSWSRNITSSSSRNDSPSTSACASTEMMSSRGSARQTVSFRGGIRASRPGKRWHSSGVQSVAPGYRRFRPLVEALPVGFRDPQELGDDPEGSRSASVSTASNALAGRDPRSVKPVSAGADRGRERPHARRREAGLHELAVPCVVGRIRVHHRGRARVLHADLERQDSLARAKCFRVAGDRDHVGVRFETAQ